MEHSVLLATHLTKELDRIADYITFLNHGKLVFSKDKESMYDSYRLLIGEDYKLNLIRKERIPLLFLKIPFEILDRNLLLVHLKLKVLADEKVQKQIILHLPYQRDILWG